MTCSLGAADDDKSSTTDADSGERLAGLACHVDFRKRTPSDLVWQRVSMAGESVVARRKMATYTDTRSLPTWSKLDENSCHLCA